MNPVLRRLCFDGLMLASLCVVGMFSIPFGDNVKVSLQLLMVFLICLLSPSVLDCLLITGCYLLLGLFLPIYAGFHAGITPTFGFVIGFVVASPAIYFLNQLPLPKALRMILACLGGLLLIYFVGTLFFCLYLPMDVGPALFITVVPYLPFDAIKIGLAIAVALALPERLLLRIKE